MSLPPPPPPPPGTPPPPPPSSPPSGRPLDVGAAFSYGWNAWIQHAGPMVGLAAVVVGVNLVIGLLGSASDAVAALVVFNLLSFVVSIVLGMGLIRGALAVTEGRMPSFSMFLETDGFWWYLIATLVYFLGVALGLVLLIVPGIIIAIMWQFYGFAIVERPTTTIGQALGRSVDITRGSRWQLLGMSVLLVLLNIVGILACGIGVIVTYGISVLTLAYAYKTLSGQPVVPPQPR
jgi:hypothetical protein